MQSIVDVVQTICLIIAIAIAIGALQAYLLRRQIKTDHDWNRRAKALEFSFSDDLELRKIRSHVAHVLGLSRSKPREVSLEEIKKNEEAESGLRAEVQFLLGRLAAMGAAINNGVVDEQLCKDLLKGTVISYYRYVRQYIEDLREVSGNREIYRCLELYARKWEQEDDPPPRQRPPVA